MSLQNINLDAGPLSVKVFHSIFKSPLGTTTPHIAHPVQLINPGLISPATFNMFTTTLTTKPSPSTSERTLNVSHSNFLVPDPIEVDATKGELDAQEAFEGWEPRIGLGGMWPGNELATIRHLTLQEVDSIASSMWYLNLVELRNPRVYGSGNLRVEGSRGRIPFYW